MSRQPVNMGPQITDWLVNEGRLAPTRDKREGDAKTGNRTRQSEVIPYAAPPLVIYPVPAKKRHRNKAG